VHDHVNVHVDDRQTTLLMNVVVDVDVVVHVDVDGFSLDRGCRSV
jgi:hypothetical protein